MSTATASLLIDPVTGARVVPSASVIVSRGVTEAGPGVGFDFLTAAEALATSFSSYPAEGRYSGADDNDETDYYNSDELGDDGDVFEESEDYENEGAVELAASAAPPRTAGSTSTGRMTDTRKRKRYIRREGKISQRYEMKSVSTAISRDCDAFSSIVNVHAASAGTQRFMLPLGTPGYFILPASRATVCDHSADAKTAPAALAAGAAVICGNSGETALDLTYTSAALPQAPHTAANSSAEAQVPLISMRSADSARSSSALSEAATVTVPDAVSADVTGDKEYSRYLQAVSLCPSFFSEAENGLAPRDASWTIAAAKARFLRLSDALISSKREALHLGKVLAVSDASMHPGLRDSAEARAREKLSAAANPPGPAAHIAPQLVGPPPPPRRLDGPILAKARVLLEAAICARQRHVRAADVDEAVALRASAGIEPCITKTADGLHFRLTTPLPPKSHRALKSAANHHVKSAHASRLHPACVDTEVEVEEANTVTRSGRTVVKKRWTE
jgi:hypothetical protein